MKQEVIDFVEKNSWFEWERNNNMFGTRRHGDVSEETFSEKDYQEALRIVKLLKEKFPQHKFEIDTVDEWVIIEEY